MYARRSCLTAAILLATGAGGMAWADQALLNSSCGGCHTETEAGLSRIEGQRKTPEGWMMTIWRMQNAHGLNISAEDRRVLVQYLSDTQGLAPSEAAPWRYALEKDPNTVEALEEPFASMCARCHTGARVGLQRRTGEEWDLHMDFHVGQFPTAEYQALARDREWFKIAKEDMVPWLTETYGPDASAWESWQGQPHAPAAGDWVFLTELPGQGEAYGKLSVSGEASPYTVSGELVLASGESLPVSGSMNLYSGYEWRANLEIGGTVYRQVLAMSEDGAGLEGRQFLRGQDSLGAPLIAARAGDAAVILGAVPSALPAGSTSAQIVGVGLDGLSASTGNAEANPYGAALSVETEGNGMLALAAGEAAFDLAYYESIDSLQVEPAFPLARVGGGSDVGPAKVPAYFSAIGFWNGPDGEPGTADDIRVGKMDAAWAMTDAHEHAAHMEDAKYAGSIDAGGVFTPGVAGPNGERPFSTNNAGELTVTAEALGQSADASLIVTVQRFIDPPIR
ncbi:MAG: quinohemoprotein amine dehydrogenase subunit alpha [Mangrovicoccus sp.]|nr:quinohemoprotein amine dehydrogenase subunit alpha [Mangrovicoccus sp.]